MFDGDFAYSYICRVKSKKSISIKECVMYKIFQLLLLVLSLMVCTGSRAQKASLEFGDMKPYSKEFQGTGWFILHYEDNNILAYSMPKGGKLALIRFDNNFNVKQRVVSSVPWYLADLEYYDGKIKGVFYDRKLTYCCFDGETLKMTEKKELFLPKGWAADKPSSTGTITGSVVRSVSWSPNHKYVGVGVFVCQVKYAYFKGFQMSHLYLYDSDFNQIATTVADYQDNPSDLSFKPDIKVFDTGELIYKVNNMDCFHILSKDGFKEYVRYDNNMDIIDYKGDSFVYIGDKIKEYDKNTQKVKTLSIQPDSISFLSNSWFKKTFEGGKARYIIPCKINNKDYGNTWLNEKFEVENVVKPQFKRNRTLPYNNFTDISDNAERYYIFVYEYPQEPKPNYAIKRWWLEYYNKYGIFEESEVTELESPVVKNYSLWYTGNREYLIWQQNITDNGKNPMQRWVRIKIED